LREAFPESAPGAPERPRFSVIILNWNGRHHLQECLESVQGQRFLDFETIVVDNGSTDGSQTWVKGRWGEEVALVALPENLGFAGGNNAGIRASRGSFVVLLNNDTVVDPGWLDALQQAAVRHPGAGMFTPKILNYYRRGEVDSTGLVIYPDGLARGRHRLEADDGRFDAEGEVLCPSGCAGVYARAMLDEIGLLDHSFFAYGEDVDLGLRGRWAGWECWYIPAARVYHKYSVTTGAFSPRKAFLVERNRIWILFKNFPAREILLSPFRTGCRYIYHLVGALSGRGAAGRFAGEQSVWRLFLTTLRAEVAAIGGVPRIVRLRRDGKKSRRMTPNEFRSLLAKYPLSAREAAWKE
jgi:GT2 family glycosyltransferase